MLACQGWSSFEGILAYQRCHILYRRRYARLDKLIMHKKESHHARLHWRFTRLRIRRIRRWNCGRLFWRLIRVRQPQRAAHSFDCSLQLSPFFVTFSYFFLPVNLLAPGPTFLGPLSGAFPWQLALGSNHNVICVRNYGFLFLKIRQVKKF